MKRIGTMVAFSVFTTVIFNLLLTLEGYAEYLWFYLVMVLVSFGAAWLTGLLLSPGSFFHGLLTSLLSTTVFLVAVSLIELPSMPWDIVRLLESTFLAYWLEMLLASLASTVLLTTFLFLWRLVTGYCDAYRIANE